MREPSRSIPGRWPESDEPGLRINPWHIALKYQWVLITATLVGGSLGYLYALKEVPTYESSAQVLVTSLKKTSLPLEGIDATLGYEDNLATHSLLIRSPLIVSRAISDHKLASLRSLAASGDPVRTVMSGIAVQRADGGLGSDNSADVLELKFRGPDPKDCQRILHAVIDTYRTFLGETAESVSKEILDLVTEAKDSLLTQLREKEAAYRKFRQEAPLLWGEGEGTNIHQARLAQIEQARSQVLLTYTQTKAQLQAVDRALKQGGNREAIMLMVENYAQSSLNQGTEKQSLAGQLLPLLVDQQMLLETHGPDHPKVRALQKRIEVTRRYLQSAVVDDEAQGGTQAVDFLEVYLDSLREELVATDERLRELDALFAQEREQAKAMADYEVIDETYRNDIARTQQLFNGVVKRLEEINLVRDYGGYEAQVISPARPGAKIGPHFPKIVALASLLGLAGSLALSYVAELADKSFRSPEQLTAELGLPIVGHVPFTANFADEDPAAETEDSDGQPKLSPALHAYHQPKSRLAEAYRAMRTALYFSTAGQGQKVIQISSPNPSDGKSFLAGNLAVSIAQSGKRTLLIDADLRRPKIHNLFHLDRHTGLTSLIHGHAGPESAIRPTVQENLWCVPSGPVSNNPAELLTSQRFQQLLDDLKSQYDFLVIDTPPLLAVTDPSVVAARADGVVLVVRNTKRAREDAMRAKEMLQSVGAKPLGVVVMGTDQSPHYGYGAYRYGRYRYGKGRYGYGYGENRNEGYCSDETTQDSRVRTTRFSRLFRLPGAAGKRHTPRPAWLDRLRQWSAQATGRDHDR